MPKAMLLMMILLGFCVCGFGQTPTVGGSPTIVAQVSLTDQTSPIPITTLVTPSSDALYRVTAYFLMTKFDQSGSHWCLTTGWTDDVRRRVKTVYIDSSANQGLPTWVSLIVSPRDKAGVPLTYQVNLCAGLVPNAYNLYITVEQLM